MSVGVQHKMASIEKPFVVKTTLPFNWIETEGQADFCAPRTLKVNKIGFVDFLTYPIRTDIDFDENATNPLFRNFHIGAVGNKNEKVDYFRHKFHNK